MRGSAVQNQQPGDAVVGRAVVAAVARLRVKQLPEPRNRIRARDEPLARASVLGTVHWGHGVRIQLLLLVGPDERAVEDQERLDGASSRRHALDDRARPPGARRGRVRYIQVGGGVYDPPVRKAAYKTRIVHVVDVFCGNVCQELAVGKKLVQDLGRGASFLGRLCLGWRSGFCVRIVPACRLVWLVGVLSGGCSGGGSCVCAHSHGGFVIWGVEEVTKGLWGGENLLYTKSYELDVTLLQFSFNCSIIFRGYMQKQGLCSGLNEGVAICNKMQKLKKEQWLATDSICRLLVTRAVLVATGRVFLICSCCFRRLFLDWGFESK